MSTARFIPEPHGNAPVFEYHDAVCDCTPCRAKPKVDVEIIPQLPRDPATRQRTLAEDDFAVLTYRGVTVKITLDFVRTLASVILVDRANEWSGPSIIAMHVALREIEKRMWAAHDNKKASAA